MYSLKFDLRKNNDYIKNMTLETNPGDWKEHHSKLTVFKKDINEYLTKLVELEKVADTEIEMDNDSESSEDEKGSKRILVSKSPVGKNKIHKT